MNEHRFRKTHTTVPVARMIAKANYAGIQLVVTPVRHKFLKSERITELPVTNEMTARFRRTLGIGEGFDCCGNRGRGVTL